MYNYEQFTVIYTRWKHELCVIETPNILLELVGGQMVAGFFFPLPNGKRLVDVRFSENSYLCRTVDPAALGATVLLGERPEAPTLDALAAGPG